MAGYIIVSLISGFLGFTLCAVLVATGKEDECLDRIVTIDEIRSIK